jgi:hypothetical protein
MCSSFGKKIQTIEAIPHIMTKEEAKTKYNQSLLTVFESAKILNNPKPRFDPDIWKSLDEYNKSIQTEMRHQSNRCSEAALNISTILSEYPELATP